MISVQERFHKAQKYDRILEKYAKYCLPVTRQLTRFCKQHMVLLETAYESMVASGSLSLALWLLSLTRCGVVSPLRTLRSSFWCSRRRPEYAGTERTGVRAVAAQPGRVVRTRCGLSPIRTVVPVQLILSVREVGAVVVLGVTVGGLATSDIKWTTATEAATVSKHAQ